MERNLRKTRVGVVVSDKMDKTIVVAVKDSVQHPLYKKDHETHREVQSARREKRVRRGRPCGNHGDPPHQRRQTLAPGADHRKGEISEQL